LHGLGTLSFISSLGIQDEKSRRIINFSEFNDFCCAFAAEIRKNGS